MIRIACLHTAASNITVFDTALNASGLTGVALRHAVRTDLLAAVEEAGELTQEIAAATVTALHSLRANADAVLLTCSTLGPAAEVAAATEFPVLRVDKALAAEAVGRGGKVIVLCAVETTLAPTRLLFETAALNTGAEPIVRLVPGAWAAFKAGQQGHYLEIIAHAARQAWREEPTQIVLAQASMAGAGDLLPQDQRPLSSPIAGLRAAVSAAR